MTVANAGADARPQTSPAASEGQSTHDDAFDRAPNLDPLGAAARPPAGFDATAFRDGVARLTAHLAALESDDARYQDLVGRLPAHRAALEYSIDWAPPALLLAAEVLWKLSRLDPEAPARLLAALPATSASSTVPAATEADRNRIRHPIQAPISASPDPKDIVRAAPLRSKDEKIALIRHFEGTPHEPALRGLPTAGPPLHFAVALLNLSGRPPDSDGRHSPVSTTEAVIAELNRLHEADEALLAPDALLPRRWIAKLDGDEPLAPEALRTILEILCLEPRMGIALTNALLGPRNERLGFIEIKRNARGMAGEILRHFSDQEVEALLRDLHGRWWPREAPSVAESA